MSLQFSAQSKDRQSVERFTTEFVQPVQEAEPNGRAAAQAARARDFFYRRTGKREATAFGPLKEKVGGLGRNRPERFMFCRARDSHKIVNAKRNPETIEAWAKIGSAGRDSDRDLFHKEALIDTIPSGLGMTKK